MNDIQEVTTAPAGGDAKNRRFSAKFYSWLPELGALAYFLVFSVVLLYPLSANLGVSTTNEGDSLQQTWVIGWGMHALTNEPANLFNGNIFYPYVNTLAYADHMLGQALQGLPIYLLTGNIVLTYGILTLFSFVLSGFFTYLLVKDITGNRAAALFAGTVFAFGHYKIGHLSQLNLLSTQWIPLCFLFLRRILRTDIAGMAGQKTGATLKSGWWAVLGLGFVFALNALSTFYYLFYIFPLLVIYFAFFYIYERRVPQIATLVKLGVAGLIAAVCVLPTFIPYAAVVAEQAAERTPRDVEQFSANYRFYVGAHWNSILWGSNLSRFAGSGGERTLFPGALAYLFAFIGVVAPIVGWFWLKIKKAPGEISRDARRERWVWVLLVGFALFMSMGWTLWVRGLEIPGIYRLFYDWFPGWVAMRAAVRYGVFVLFGVALLGGLGIAWLAQRKVFSRKIVGNLAAVALLGVTLFEYRYEIPYINPGILPNPPQVYKWLAQPENAGVVVELPAPPDIGNPPSIRNFYTTYHWQPYVNGVAAYIPPVQTDLANLLNTFPTSQGIAALQGIGVRWLVFHLEDENTPLAPGAWQKIEAQLSKTPEVKLAQDFPADKIKVYELAPNGWIRQAYAGLPPNSDVFVSDFRRSQPTLIELFQTMLRRDGHNIYGTERAGYRFLTPPPAGKPVSAGIFAADEDPTLYGFAESDQTWSGYGLRFYQRKEKVAAAYDFARDPKLNEFYSVKGALELGVENNGLKFNGKNIGSGTQLQGDGRVTLQLSSFEPVTLKIGGETVNLAGGLAIWRSGALKAGQTLRIEGEAGKTFYLNRAELKTYDASQPAGLTAVPGATLLRAETRQDGTRFITTLTVFAPPLSEAQKGEYIVTLDVYRRPWGTHPNGHFGNYSVALDGQNRTRTVEFNFDPATRSALATIDGAGVGIGAENFKPGDGKWTAFAVVRRNSPAKPADFPLVGLSRIYEFDLENNAIVAPNFLPGKPLVLLPAR
jgi:hypothetical protein